MKTHHLAALISAFLIPAAHAGDAPYPVPNGLTVSGTTTLLVTHYSATPRGGKPCKYECGWSKKKGKRICSGGPDGSPSGVRPLSATVEKPGPIHGRTAVLTAVPQVNKKNRKQQGTAGMFGCFFSIQGVAEYKDILFYAGDRYGPDSTGKFKTDLSSTCTTRVNTQIPNTKVVIYNCPGKKGGPGIPIARDRESPRQKAPVKKEGRLAKKEAVAPEPAKVADEVKAEEEVKVADQEKEAPAKVSSAKRRPAATTQRRRTVRSRKPPPTYAWEGKPWHETFWQRMERGGF